MNDYFNPTIASSASAFLTNLPIASRFLSMSPYTASATGGHHLAPHADEEPLMPPAPAFRSGGTVKASNLVHSGFYDIWNSATMRLGLGGGERFEREVESLIAMRYEDLLASSPPKVGVGGGVEERQVKTPTKAAGKAKEVVGAGWPAVGRFLGGVTESPVVQKKVKKNSISWPMDFRHVAHASTAEEAQYLLMRWAADGMGKVANPVWAKALRDNVRQRAADQQARAIAQVVVAREQGLIRDTPFQTLRVVNGLPSSVYSSTLAATSHRTPNTGPRSGPRMTPVDRAPGTPRSPLANPFESAFRPLGKEEAAKPEPKEGGGVRDQRPPILEPTKPLNIKRKSMGPPTMTVISPGRKDLPEPQGVEVEIERMIDGLPIPLSPTMLEIVTPNKRTFPPSDPSSSSSVLSEPLTARAILPSLPTLEKAASTAIFFETLYHALLKPPPSLSAAHHSNYLLSRERRRLALEEEMARRGLKESEKERARRRWVAEETVGLRERRRKVDVRSFEKLKIIGHGAFGVVSLVREKETGGLFAMKQLRKADMLRKGQEGHVRAEKDLLAAASNSQSPWIVKLFYTFQDTDNLYLIMSYESGGDLLNLLIKHDTFSESTTRFYIAELVLALSATHSLGFIHRDIKPDNLFLSPTGHLRVADFGLATDLQFSHDAGYYEQQRAGLLKRHGVDLEDGWTGRMKTVKRREVEAVAEKKWLEDGEGMLTWRDKKRRKLAMSVCGTNAYMSPEVIRGRGYGFSCDWWSMGVIAFECLYGYPPFIASTRHLTRQKILAWRQSLKFPTTPVVSRECTDFIARLLCEPEDRLGSGSGSSVKGSAGTLKGGSWGLGRDGAGEIMAHGWFKGLDWENLHLEKAPFVPELDHAGDTRNFDDDIPDEPLARPDGAPADATKDVMLRNKAMGGHLLELRKGMAFAGWTYKASKNALDPRYDLLKDVAFPMSQDGVMERSRSVRSRALSL